MVQGALSSMLERWLGYVYVQGRTRCNEAMLNRKLSMAFEKWQFTAAEMTRQQFMMQGVLDLVHRRALSTTLGVIN